MYLITFCLALALLCSCSGRPAAQSNGIATNTNKGAQTNMDIRVTSKAFQEGGMIPSQYTCDGADISPPLEWSHLPAAAKSLALICDDPDAPGKTWVHWVMYDIPAGASDLVEAVKPEETLQ